jgi:DHA1 family tetracycline resistance protein-like MFS transporter
MPIALLPLLAITFVDVLGFSILIPILPFYAEHFGASTQAIGMLVATVAICGLLSSPIMGAMSDRVGRRAVLITTQSATTIAYFLLARATSLPMLFVARGIEGISSGGIGVTQAYLADVTTPEQRGQAYSYLGMTYGLGFIFGPALGGALLRFGYPTPFLVAAILSIGTILLTIFLLPESHTPAAEQISPFKALSVAFSDAALRKLLSIQLCFTLGFTMWVTVLALFLQRVFHFGPEQTSLLYTCNGVIGVAMQAFAVGRLVKKFGEKRILIAGLLCAFATYFMIGEVTWLPIMFIATAFWALGNSLSRPTISTILSHAAPEQRRGAFMGASDGCNDLAFCIGPIVASNVLTISPHLIGILPAMLTVTALFLVRTLPSPQITSQVVGATV